MKAQLTHKFSFDNIIVDPKSNAIYINGIEKRLEPKLINLLCLFAAQGRDAISRQEITQIIWPGVVVGEESITRAIFALRNALGDDAKQPQYIETIPKKGYRFLADVELVSETPILVESATATGVISNKRSWSLYFVCAVLLVIALLVIIKRHEKPAVEIESILPLNKMEGVERSISLNADGTQLLFIHDDGKKNDLYSRDLQTAKDVLWVHDEFTKKSPVWIDTNTIAYIRQNLGEMQVVRNYQGQPPQVLYSVAKTIGQLSIVNGDSENLFFLEFQKNNFIELKSINLRNGKQQSWNDSIPEFPNKVGQLQYSKKPDTLLMVKDEYEQPTILSLDLTTKKITVINNQFSEINKVVAINDSTLMVIGTLGTASGIWFVEDSKSPQLVLRSSGSEKIVDAQIDVKRNIIFYANLENNVDVNMVSIHKQETLRLPELNSSGIDTKATFSNNNKSIYFTSNRSGLYDIWRYDIETKSVKQITTLNAFMVRWYSLSHDGKKLAVGYRTDDLYLGVIDVETGRLLRHVKTSSYRFPLAWSNDDTTIYASEHEAEINLFQFDSITLKQTLFAERSGLYVKDIDGTSLVYVDFTRHALVERNLKTKQEKILHDTIPELMELFPGKFKVNKTNDGFYSNCQIEWVNKMCFFSLSEPNSAPVFLSHINRWQMLDITDDGETMLTEDIKPPSGDIMKMQLRD